ncbi:MAG TPA: protein kinase [Stenomitos sp.]
MPRLENELCERVTPMLGKLLDRRYEVTQVLGAGGFGRTYLARDTRRPGNPTCVVKQLKPISNDPNFLETARRLFNSEAETLEQLGHHDQIPRLLAYFEEDQEFYLVQEFIEGHTLTQELQPGQRWEESRVMTLLEEVLSILDFVHSHGVIHRDIKPDNLIRRNSDHKLVLVDFGAVKQIRTQFAATQGRASNTVAIGTPGYMASEQALGQPRPTSDIYALGIIGIQALTGLMPVNFQEDLSTGEILWQHLVPVSRGLATLLSKMVRYHFKDRYQSAAEALESLRLMNNTYSPSTPYPAVPRTPSANDAPPLGQRVPPPPYPPSISEHQTLAASPKAPPRQPSTPPLSSPAGGTSDKTPLLVGIGMAIAVGAVGMAFAMRQGSWTSNFSGNGTSVADTSNGSCTVVSGGLNVRSGPSSNEDVIETVKKGTNLALSGAKKNGWVEINSPIKGWVYNSSKLVKCTLAAQTPVETAQVNPKPVETTVSPKPAETTASPKPIQIPLPKPSTTPQQPVDNSSKTLDTAADKYENGDLKGAIADAQKVLPGSEAYKEAQAKIQKWQQDWAAAEAKYNELQQALNEGDWKKVLITATDPKFFEQRYWQDRAKQLLEEAKKRKAEADAEANKNPTTPPEEPLQQKPLPDANSPGKGSPNPKGENQDNPTNQ